VSFGGGGVIMAASIAALPTAAHNNSINNNGGNNMSEKAAKQSEQCSGSDSEMMSISLQMEEPTNNEMTSTGNNIAEASPIELQPIITISGSFTDGNSVSTMWLFANTHTPNQTYLLKTNLIVSFS